MKLKAFQKKEVFPQNTHIGLRCEKLPKMLFDNEEIKEIMKEGSYTTYLASNAANVGDPLGVCCNLDLPHSLTLLMVKPW